MMRVGALPVTMRAMASSGPLKPARRLLGRERECAMIDALLEDARSGVSGALTVRGEAGIGKSALLGYAMEQAASMTVLTITGVEAESDLAFAGMYGLLRPVLEHLSELPETQSRALAGALGLAPSAKPDRLLISAAVLALLAAAAEYRPTQAPTSRGASCVSPPRHTLPGTPASLTAPGKRSGWLCRPPLASCGRGSCTSAA
jgi:hypothetical protein